MKKRFLSLLCVLALCLGLLPVTALAAEGAPTALYVGNQVLKNSTSYWKTDPATGELTEYTEGGDAWNVQYNPETVTLTLKNATVVGKAYGDNNGGIGIYATSSSGSLSLNIVLDGNSKVSGMYGINVVSNGNASLNISGSGSLTVSGPNYNGIGIFLNAQNGDATLTIDGVSVTASGDQLGGSGVQLLTGQTGSPNLSIEVKGGNLQASGATNGIHFLSNVDGATAVANLKVSGNAMVKASNIITTKNGTGLAPELKPAASGSDGTGGIIWDGKEGTVYGEVTLQEDLTIESGQTLDIPSGASLNTDGKLTVDGGTLTQNGTVTGGVIYKVTGVSLNTDSLTLVEGGTATLTATVKPDEASNKSVNWESSAPGVASVDENGEVTAVSAGDATIKVTTEDGEFEATCSVTVNSAATVPVESVSLDKTTLGLTEGETAQLTATVEPEDASNKNVTWESSNTNVATVNNGEVTAVSAGTATITVTTVDGGKTATCTVTVKPAEYTVTVLTDGKGSASASPATAEAGTTVTLTADPDNGWRFARWEVVEGDVTISGNSFTMPAENVTVRAVFIPVVNLPDTHSIDLIVSDGGEARLSLTNASEGSTITVTATPDAGYELDYITVDGERIDGTTFTMPDHDVTVRVYFTDGAALPFTDVSAGAWYFDAVGYVYVGGLMDGVSDTLFDPDGTMTRAMVWAILARVDGETVTGEDWIETAREWAVANGVSDGENANGYVTREQFATMLWRYAGEPETDGSGVGVFDDGETVSIWAFDAMSWALNNGVITGVSDDALLPANTATRAQCAAMLMRFVEAIG